MSVAKKSSGKLRIIGGEWRSRLLPVVDLPGLRPTTDRVRETLFNWLQNDIPGSHCLDLFAGSGALGFEAASRGAASVTMLELQAQAFQALRNNCEALQANQIQLWQQDAMNWLKSSPDQSFGVVFIDPPFDADLLGSACRLLEDSGCLTNEACVYLEASSGQPLPELPDCWKIVRQKKAGQVSYYLARRMPEQD